MPTAHQQSDEETDTGHIAVRKIESYIHDQVADESLVYLQSKEIASAIGLSAKQVGYWMSTVQTRDNGLSVSKWGKSNATTWQVETADQSA